MCDIVRSRNVINAVSCSHQAASSRGHHEEAVLRDDTINGHPDALSKQAWHGRLPDNDAMSLTFILLNNSSFTPSALLLCSIHNHA